MANRIGLGARLKNLFGLGSENDEFFDQLEDILIEGDLGPLVAMEAVDTLRERVQKNRALSREEVLAELKDILRQVLVVSSLVPEKGRLNLYLILGVNGVGKTTTIAKLANYYRRYHNIERILLSAGDTFRAAAIDQLKVLGDRLNLTVISQAPGADPGAVIFDTISSAQATGADLVLADTAGRMHTKQDLVRELSKIDRVVQKRMGTEGYRKVLVIDATTGQNALHQAEVFHEAIGVDSIILAKYDSTAKGGIVVPICRKIGLPFSFMGTGEKLENLVPFDSDIYLDTLIGINGSS
jgi:fused signal recognition particle receptor